MCTCVSRRDEDELASYNKLIRSSVDKGSRRPQIQMIFWLFPNRVDPPPHTHQQLQLYSCALRSVYYTLTQCVLSESKRQANVYNNKFLFRCFFALLQRAMNVNEENTLQKYCTMHEVFFCPHPHLEKVKKIIRIGSCVGFPNLERLLHSFGIPQ